jgi:hypothetical protein
VRPHLPTAVRTIHSHASSQPVRASPSAAGTLRRVFFLQAGGTNGEVKATWTVAGKWHRMRVDRYVAEKLRAERRPVRV